MAPSNPEFNESKWKALAEKNTILRVLVGSQAYGLSLEASSDRDERGVCIEPLEAYVAFSEFEQYEYRTATERTGIKDAPSQAGDLDLTIYSLRKFLRLALQGNPSVVELLFIKQPECQVVHTSLGTDLQEMAPLIVSRQAGKRFLGYMESQRQRLLGEIGQKKVNRLTLEERYGFDTKYAMHILRLGYQGVELLTSGKITLPMGGESAEFCLATRKGELSLHEVLTKAGELERQVKDLLDTSPLAERPNQDAVEDWMRERYWNWWKAQRVLVDRAPYEALLRKNNPTELGGL